MLVVCIIVCTYVTELQYSMVISVATQATQVTSGVHDQIRVQIYGDMGSAMLVEKIRELPAVQAVAAERWPYAFASAHKVTSRDGRVILDQPPICYVSVQATYFLVRGLVLADGRFLHSGETTNVAVVGSALADAMGWHVGDEIKSGDIAESYKIVGILAPAEASVDFSNRPDQQGVDDSVFVPFDRPATQLEVRDGVTPPNQAYAFYIQSKPGLLDECVKQVSDLFAATTGLTGGRVLLDVRPVQSVLRVAAGNFANSFSVLTWVIYAVAAAAFSSVFLARVTSRAKEIGIKRALGMSGMAAVRELVAEATLISALGSLVATAVFSKTYSLFGITWGSQGFSFMTLAPHVCLSTLLGPLGVIAPAMVAARITPMSSIRDELAWGPQRRRLDLRQAYALASLGLAVAAILFSSSLGLSTVSEVDRQLRAVGANDVEVTAKPLSSATIGLAQFESLEAALPVDVPAALVYQTETGSWSIDGRDWKTVTLIGFSGDLEGSLGFSSRGGLGTDLTDNEVILGDSLARLLGGDAAIGKTVLIGPGAEAFRIAGVVSPRPKNVYDRGADRDQTIFLSLEGFSRVANQAAALARIAIRCPDQASADAVQAVTADTLGSSYAVSRPFGTLRELRSLRVRFSACIFSGTVALCLAVAVALGILMIMRMWETRRSMAIQIALGATSRQVAFAIGLDMLEVTLMASLGGIALGLSGYLIFAAALGLPVQVGVTGALVTATIGLVVATLIGAVCFLFFRGKSVAQYLHD